MKAREMLATIRSDGWTLDRIKGSHHVFVHATKPGIIVVPIHAMGDDIPAGTAASILKQAGIKR